MRRKRIRENKETLKKTEEQKSLWSLDTEDAVESDGEDKLVIVEETPDQEEIENSSLAVSLPIDLYHNYLNHKSIMSRKTKSKTIDDANGTYDGTVNPTNVTQPTAKRARSNSEFPNADYQNILKNIYQSNRNTDVNAGEMKLTRQYEVIKKTHSIQEINNYGLPYLPHPDITICILPNIQENELKTKQKLPQSTPAEEYFENESNPTADNSTAVVASQNIRTNVSTITNEQETHYPDLESNVLNLSKPKDLEPTDPFILSEDEINLIRLVRESQINIQTLMAFVAKGDLNNNVVLVNNQNLSDTIDLVDDDDDQGMIVDPKVLQALEDQSAANKKIISTMYAIAKAASGTELNADLKSEIILSILNSDAPGVLSEQLTDYIKKIVATSKVTVEHKSTETIPIRMFEMSENVQVVTVPIQETEVKAVAPHCPSQEVHSLMCRPNHHHVRPGHTNDLIQQSAQMYVPQQGTYSNNATVIRQNVPYRNKQTQQDTSFLHTQTMAAQAYPNKQMLPQQEAAGYMHKQALTGASASYPNKQMMPQNYGNGFANYQTQNIMNPQPHPQTPQNILYQNNSTYTVQRTQHGAPGFYNTYPNQQQHQHQQWTQAQYNAQRGRNRQHEVSQQNLGNLYW